MAWQGDCTVDVKLHGHGLLKEINRNNQAMSALQFARTALQSGLPVRCTQTGQWATDDLDPIALGVTGGRITAFIACGVDGVD